jgi:hypothetical protein
MIDGVVLLWFVLTALALLFVVYDIRTTPESPVLKWGFVLLTAYTGVFGAFLYVLGCREPLPQTHELYVAARWRQVLGSTMHCVAGDGVGILAGAVISTTLGLAGYGEALLEYLLGFGFGWTIFQALFMRDMVGGSYVRSLATTFIAELLSMNLLMAAMVPTMMILRSVLAPTAGPGTPVFWFVMSMALLAGFIAAYPMNWWLVANHLKHGMMTIRTAQAEAAMGGPGGHAGMNHPGQGGSHDAMASHITQNRDTPVPSVAVMAVVSFVALAAGLIVARLAVAM